MLVSISCRNEVGDGNSSRWVELVTLPWSSSVLVEPTT